MDNLAHSLVGLTSAKAGLERLSPYATTVCLVSANIADADFVSLVFGDRWTLLQHHRGITHSIIGTIAIGLLVPALAFAIEQVIVRLRKRPPRIRFGGLLVASIVAAATHPLMDWTNNYGIRPFLPWSGQWFYGDLAFIVDPYVWLVLGGTAFLLTSTTRLKTVAWAALAAGVTGVIVFAARRRAPDSVPVVVASVVWSVAGLLLIVGRIFGAQKHVGRSTAVAALGLVALYWGGLALMHRAAFANTLSIADSVAARRSERFIRAAAMPTVATPFRWQSVAETDQAMYRFMTDVRNGSKALPSEPIDRFEKPTGEVARLVSLAERDRRAQVLLGFARFPIGQLQETNCVGRTLVQLADLRYTEPGLSRGSFSVEIPIDCPAR